MSSNFVLTGTYYIKDKDGKFEIECRETFSESL